MFNGASNFRTQKIYIVENYEGGWGEVLTAVLNAVTEDAEPVHELNSSLFRKSSTNSWKFFTKMSSGSYCGKK